MKIMLIKKYYFDQRDKERLKKFMYKNNMTHYGLADKLGIHVDMLEKMLSGKRAISDTNIIKLKSLGFHIFGYKYNKEK